MDGFALDQRFDLPRVQFRRNADGFDKRRELLAEFIPPVKNVDTKRNKVSGLIVAPEKYGAAGLHYRML